MEIFKHFHDFISVENEMKYAFGGWGGEGEERSAGQSLGHRTDETPRERARWWPKGFLPERNLQPKFARE